MEDDWTGRTRGQLRWPGRGQSAEWGTGCWHTRMREKAKISSDSWTTTSKQASHQKWNTHGLLDVVVRQARGQVRVARGRRRRLHDLAAVDQVVDVVAEQREVVERVVEPALDLRLVVHEALPLARRPAVPREQVVRLEAQLAVQRGLDLALVPARAGEDRAPELGLDEELGVEELGGRVEGRAGDGGVDVVSGGDGMRGEEGDDLGGREAADARERVLEAGEDAVDGVERLRDGLVGRGLGGVGAANEDVQLGSTGAVRDTNGTSQLDEVGGGEVVPLDERPLLVDDLVDAVVGVEVGLDVLEDGNRSVSASTSVGMSARFGDISSREY